ncbi:hypothetical protein SEA_OREGANO_35 [Gordonia phage Oregano]|nr:hypothetical protein SEA_OREGANO_35 [Gordonia phage Oregano]
MIWSTRSGDRPEPVPPIRPRRGHLDELPTVRAVRIVRRLVDPDPWRHGVWTHSSCGRFQKRRDRPVLRRGGQAVSR